MKLKAGDKAPTFKLFSSENEELSSEDLQGQSYVLLFFPMAFTSVCTEELCHMRDNIGRFNDLDARIIAISVDSPFTLAKFKEDQNLNFPLLSDFNKEVSRAFGSLYEKFVMGMKGVSKRSAFVIDGDGIIRYAEVLEQATDQPNYEAIEKAFEKI